MSSDHKLEVIAATPPVAAVGLKLFGISLPDWAAIVAIVYTLLMIAEFGVRKYRYYITRRDRREGDGQ